MLFFENLHDHSLKIKGFRFLSVTNYRDYYLISLLAIEIKPKITLKAACDIDHPIAYEALSELGLEQQETLEIVEKIKAHSKDCLSYFQLFKEVIDLEEFSMKPVIDLAEKIIRDSKCGTVISHSSKMTNPACKFPRIYFNDGIRAPDGLIRSGNITTDFDLHIDAAKLKVFKFLTLPLEQSTIFEQLKAKNSKSLQLIFGIDTETANTWCNQLQTCITSQVYHTHHLVKQVWFPIENGYHQLSLLQPSGLVFQLKERIDQMNHRSVDTYVGKKAYKDNTYYEKGYKTILNLTLIKHGGDHPKNISGLNNRYQTCYLLDSRPPFIEPWHIKFPTKDFFIQTLRYNDCKKTLVCFDNILKAGYGDQMPLDSIRKARDRCLSDILDVILLKMIAIRKASFKQFWPKTSGLPTWQKIWLCEIYNEQRFENDHWLNTLCENISLWINDAYKNSVKHHVMLGEAERYYIKEFIENNKEELRREQ